MWNCIYAVIRRRRETKDSEIDYTAGLILYRKVGDYVEAGEKIAVMYASDETLFANARSVYEDAITIQEEKL